MSTIAIIIHNLDQIQDEDLNETTTLNKPKKRLLMIFDKLRPQYAVIDTHTIILDDQLFKNILEMNHETSYIDFLQHAYMSWNQETNLDFDYIKNNGLVPYHFCKNKPYHFNQLTTWKRIGYYANDCITPIYIDTYQVILRSAKNSYIAARSIIEKTNHKILYCLNAAPGHHAKYDTYGGYCFFNNAMIAARELAINQYKVSLIDVDYHAGDGAPDILSHKPHSNIKAYSIHADPNKDYPSYGGWPSKYNIIFPAKSTWTQYLICLNHIIEQVKLFDPDVIIIPFGGDTFNLDSDPSVLYGCKLDIQNYFDMGVIFSKNFPNKKFIVTQEGGYNYSFIAQIVDTFLQGLNQ